jgi:GNAT superfamily N-acetyltransferase
MIEGFELEPIVRQPWHPPYYQRHIEQLGYAKAMDLFFWDLHVKDRGAVMPIMWELAEKVSSEHGIVIRKMSRRRLRKDMDKFAEVYNAAWSENWGFVPYSKKDLDMYAMDMQLVFDKHWFMVAEKQDTGELVAMAISIPDINQVLKKMKGRILPFGWWYFLRKQKYMDRVRVGFLGVMPQHQHTGVAAKLYEEHYDMAEIRPQDKGETGWILETNTAMNRGMEMMGGKIVKRYRMYERVF